VRRIFREVNFHRDGVLPLLRLGRWFGCFGPAQSSLYALVVGAGLDAIGLGFDRIDDQREIFVRRLADPLDLRRALRRAATGLPTVWPAAN